GFMYLARVDAPVGFSLDAIPATPRICALIPEKRGVPLGEMYTVFNMGIGVWRVVCPHDGERAMRLLRQSGEKPCILGKATDDAEKAVRLTKQRVVGTGHRFERF